jgi:branched-chain amino acid transport system substrate-binding protein
MKRRNKAGIIIAVIFTILLLSGCETYNNFKTEFFGSGKNPESVVRIGVFEPLSGAYQAEGELEKKGIMLAHELYHRVLGKEVELVIADNKSDIYVAEAAIKNLISKEPSVVLGSYGGVYSLIAAEYLEEARIPAIAITNTNWLVTSNNPYYFRVCFVYAYEGIALAKYAVEEMGVESAAIFKPINDDSAIAVSQAFGDKMAQLTGNENVIVSSQDYDPAETDFTAQLVKIKSSGAEVVFLPARAEDAVLVLQQAKELRINAVFFGTNNWETANIIEKAGDAAEGVAFSTIFDPESGITMMTDAFLKAYRKKYGEDAVPESPVALGFDAYLLALDAISRAGTSTEGYKIMMELSRTREFQGASGSISFDEKGDPIKSVVIKTVSNGEMVSTYTVEPVWGAPETEEEEQ